MYLNKKNILNYQAISKFSENLFFYNYKKDKVSRKIIKIISYKIRGVISCFTKIMKNVRKETKKNMFLYIQTAFALRFLSGQFMYTKEGAIRTRYCEPEECSHYDEFLYLQRLGISISYIWEIFLGWPTEEGAMSSQSLHIKYPS